MWRGTLGLLLLLAGGDKPGPDRQPDAASPNREFVLEVDRQAGRIVVFAAKGPKRPLWRIERSFPALEEHYLLSNDGKVVAIVASRYLKADEPSPTGIEFWNKREKFRSYNIDQLCQGPVKAPSLPPGQSKGRWLVWYGGPTNNGEYVSLTTTEGVALVFRLTDGLIVERRPPEEREAHPLLLLWGPCVGVFVVAYVVFLVGMWYARRRRGRGS